jgi:hypothetical protein
MQVLVVLAPPVHGPLGRHFYLCAAKSLLVLSPKPGNDRVHVFTYVGEYMPTQKINLAVFTLDSYTLDSFNFDVLTKP